MRGLSEVAGLCEFLDAAPFYQPSFWKSRLMDPYAARTRAGLLGMRALLSGLMLRRTKVQVRCFLLVLSSGASECWSLRVWGGLHLGGVMVMVQQCINHPFRWFAAV
jgi:hypothetical protein